MMTMGKPGPLAFSHVLACVVLFAACGSSGSTEKTDGGPTDLPCEGLACAVVDCSRKGLPPTSLTGRVFAPNGTLALYGVNVYVPAMDPGPLPSGVRCDRCSDGPQGGAIALAITDETGSFKLDNVPATTNVPVVVQVGKWRRQLTIPNIAACQNLAIDEVATRLPSKQSEGDIPLIAITTGYRDALECLVRKLGVHDSEFTTDTQGGRVHMFAGGDALETRNPDTGEKWAGAKEFAPGFAGGTGAFPSAATSLWNTAAKLANYDVAILSCEGRQGPETKPMSSMQALQAYAGLGGRVFLSHWHNIWIGGNETNPAHALPDWKALMEFNFDALQPDTEQLTVIDENSPKGAQFATWMQNVGASTTRGLINVTDPRYTAQKILDKERVERWIYVDPAKSDPLGRTGVQNALFTTPVNVQPSERCGKVVFSDMHVSTGDGPDSSSSTKDVPFPGGCSSSPLSAQEKALAFILFDISTCVGPIL